MRLAIKKKSASKGEYIISQKQKKWKFRMMMRVECPAYVYVSYGHRRIPYTTRNQASAPQKSRRVLFLSVGFTLLPLVLSNGVSWSLSNPNPQIPKFIELPNSGGVKALELRIGDGDSPLPGDVVTIHYYGRLAAKQGWRFDSTYDHKDETGEPIPFSFILGSGKVISGIETCVKSMKVGGLRRVIIPPSQGYQNTSQEPLPPNYFDRQRLFTTIFNPTRLANGEGSTLGTLIFDVELVSLRHQ